VDAVQESMRRKVNVAITAQLVASRQLSAGIKVERFKPLALRDVLRNRVSLAPGFGQAVDSRRACPAANVSGSSAELDTQAALVAAPPQLVAWVWEQAIVTPRHRFNLGTRRQLKALDLIRRHCP